MKIFTVILGVVLIFTVLWETFETIVLPRRVTRQFRLTRFFYRATWQPWTWLASLRSNKKKHDSLLSYYGPLSLLLLLALWAERARFILRAELRGSWWMADSSA